MDVNLTRRRTLQALLAGAALPLNASTALAATVTDWSTAGGDAGRTGQGDAGPGTTVQRWAESENDPTGVAVSDGIAYFGRASGGYVVSGGLTAREVTTGTLVFDEPLDGRPYESPAVADGTVVAAGGPLHAFDATTGAELWAATDANTTSSPAIAGGTVYVGSSSDGAVKAYDLATGTQEWTRTLPSDPDWPVAVADGTVVVATTDGTVRALSATDGSKLWRTDAGNGVRPTVAGGSVFGASDGAVFALSLSDGSTRWRSPVGSVAAFGLATDGSRLFGLVDSGVVALDVGTGAVVWETALDELFSAPPSVADGVLYVIGTETLYSVDATVGTVLDATVIADTGSVPSANPAVDADAAVVADDGIYAFEPDRPGVSATTGTASDVGFTTATLSGDLTALNSTDSAEVFFQYAGDGGIVAVEETDPVTLTQPDTVSASLSGLRQGETYQFRLVARGADGTTDTGVFETFSTDAALDVDATLPSTTETTATLDGYLSGLGGADSAAVGFEWGLVGDGFPNTLSAGTLNDTGNFEAGIDGLSPGTEYEFRATADASDGDTDVSDPLTFSTVAENQAPTVDRLALTLTGGGNNVNLTASWSVSDPDGDLDTVSLALTDSSGATLDTASTSVSGGSAEGQSDLKGKGNGDYTVTVTVTDSGGNTGTESQSFTTDGGNGGY